MIHKSAKLKLGGKTLRLFLGYSTQRRLGCKTLDEFIFLCRDIFIQAPRGEDGKLVVVDVGTEAIERIVCAAACEVAADGETLRHAKLTPDEFRDLIDADAERMAEVIYRCAHAIEEAFSLAEILPPKKPGDDTPTQEAGESDPDPTRARRTAESASSAPAPA